MTSSVPFGPGPPPESTEHVSQGPTLSEVKKETIERPLSLSPAEKKGAELLRGQIAHFAVEKKLAVLGVQDQAARKALGQDLGIDATLEHTLTSLSEQQKLYILQPEVVVASPRETIRDLLRLQDPIAVWQARDPTPPASAEGAPAIADEPPPVEKNAPAPKGGLPPVPLGDQVDYLRLGKRLAREGPEALPPLRAALSGGLKLPKQLLDEQPTSTQDPYAPAPPPEFRKRRVSGPQASPEVPASSASEKEQVETSAPFVTVLLVIALLGWYGFVSYESAAGLVVALLLLAALLAAFAG